MTTRRFFLLDKGFFCVFITKGAAQDFAGFEGSGRFLF